MALGFFNLKAILYFWLIQIRIKFKLKNMDLKENLKLRPYKSIVLQKISK